jgi:hypothetical protein
MNGKTRCPLSGIDCGDCGYEGVDCFLKELIWVLNDILEKMPDTDSEEDL